jgi:ABC-type uncharacterized transport system substrate-binding protein
MKRALIGALPLLVAALSAFADQGRQGAMPLAAKPKVLYVNSYDLDLNWSRNALEGALAVFNVQMDANYALNDSASPVAFKLFNMKTKKNPSTEYKHQAALEAKALIEAWQPDVVICADDNASKYLIVPYFKNTDLPFVFCGVNWSAAEYGFPCSNVTGMIEVFPIQEILNILGPHANGSRLGFISRDNMSERKNIKYIRDIFKVDLVARLVSSLAEFESAFQEIQQETDMLLVGDIPSLPDFDEERFFEITQAHTIIPTASTTNVAERLRNFLVTCKRVPEEQGEWAATAAMDILDGKSPADIPVAMNKKAAIRLNMKLAKKLGITFPMELIERSTFVSEDPVKSH